VRELGNRRETFSPKRNDKCFCGSGQHFKHCCGSTLGERKAPHGIVIVEDFIAPQRCQDLLAIMSAQSSERLTLMDPEKSTAEKVERKYDDQRVTERVDMSDHQEILNELVANAVTGLIEPDLGTRYDWFEEPQVLKYQQGGFYAAHSDCENFDPEGHCWVRAQDRDLSLLIYLDDDYEGGAVYFPNFDFKIRPRPGMLIYFPSDNRYLHTAQAVTSGTRHAIVSWLSATGVEKLRAPPEGAVLLPSA
jgi:predicted 2-oxoglutarate/Fe(II)-dependent dioxygenase YbiX